MIKPEENLELSIKALRAYNVEPAIIKNMLFNLQKVVDRNSNNANCQNIVFSSEDELKRFIKMHIPIAIRPTRAAKTMFISPFSSANAENVVIDTLAKAFFNLRKRIFIKKWN